jgi:hypothetical protein
MWPRNARYVNKYPTCGKLCFDKHTPKPPAIRETYSTQTRFIFRQTCQILCISRTYLAKVNPPRNDTCLHQIRAQLAAALFYIQYACISSYDEKTSSAECIGGFLQEHLVHIHTTLQNKTTTTCSHIPRNISTINIQSYRNSKVPVSASSCCVNFDMHVWHTPWFVMTSWSCEQRWPQRKSTYALHIRNTKISSEQRMINMLNHAVPLESVVLIRALH